MIEVMHPGLLTSLQDLGRHGYAHLGIGSAGVADVPAARLANALVGNRADACLFECSLQGPRLRFDGDTWIALCGAPMPHARCDHEPLPMWRAVRVRAGQSLTLGGMSAGCRSYLAVAGGIDVAPVLGSRSTDLNARLGPLHGRPLNAGDVLPVATTTPSAAAATSHWSLDPAPWFQAASPMAVRILEGEHSTCLEPGSLTALSADTLRVEADSNRVGVRLRCQRPLRLHRPLELLSEACVPGVVQLPPDGQPIVLLNEHPVTGGYPRIAQVADVDLPRLAQCRPGDHLQLIWTSPEAAAAALREQRRMLGKLEADIARRRQGAV